MLLRSIRLLHFKNYASAEAVFSHAFTLINGLNGSGKTNLIDAVYYLCLCRSYFTRSDSSVLQHDAPYFRIDGTFSNPEGSLLITCKYLTAKKEVLRNEVPYDRISDHIGNFPVAMIAPDDINIINEGSEERRRFLDAAISQLDREYLHNLILYNKYLVQRNALFKQALGGGIRPDATLVGVLNHSLALHGNAIYRARRAYLEAFTPIFRDMYSRISGGTEEADISYKSQLEEHDHLHLLLHSERDDRAAGRTTSGIHKDDLYLSVKQYPVRDTGSQGQIKSFLIALKLAQCYMMFRSEGKQSILLLDDIFEKLDKQRLEVLFNILQDEVFCQVFITDADTKRSMEFCKSHLPDFGHIHVNNGKIEYL